MAFFCAQMSAIQLNFAGLTAVKLFLMAVNISSQFFATLTHSGDHLKAGRTFSSVAP